MQSHSPRGFITFRLMISLSQKGQAACSDIEIFRAENKEKRGERKTERETEN